MGAQECFALQCLCCPWHGEVCLERARDGELLGGPRSLQRLAPAAKRLQGKTPGLYVVILPCEEMLRALAAEYYYLEVCDSGSLREWQREACSASAL